MQPKKMRKPIQKRNASPSTPRTPVNLSSAPQSAKLRKILSEIAELNEQRQKVAAQKVRQIYDEMKRGNTSRVGTQEQRLILQGIRRKIDEAESINDYAAAKNLHKELARKEREFGLG